MANTINLYIRDPLPVTLTGLRFRFERGEGWVKEVRPFVKIWELKISRYTAHSLPPPLPPSPLPPSSLTSLPPSLSHLPHLPPSLPHLPPSLPHLPPSLPPHSPPSLTSLPPSPPSPLPPSLTSLPPPSLTPPSLPPSPLPVQSLGQATTRQENELLWQYPVLVRHRKGCGLTLLVWPSGPRLQHLPLQTLREVRAKVSSH